MRNRRREQELKDIIVRLRNEERVIKAELEQAMIDLYIAQGWKPNQALVLVQGSTPVKR